MFSDGAGVEIENQQLVRGEKNPGGEGKVKT